MKKLTRERVVPTISARVSWVIDVYKRQGVVWIEVTDAVWMRQMISLRGTLEREIARIAGLPVAGIHFELKKHH